MAQKTKRKIVYFLGAGFSRPLGLPLMADFLDMARDVYYGSDADLPHFKAVLDTINSLYVTTGTYRTDLANIEEIFSILEMRAQLGRGAEVKAFSRFIADTLHHYTPEQSFTTSSQRAIDTLFGERPWQELLLYVSALLGMRFTKVNVAAGSREEPRQYVASCEPDGGVEYAVITVNYDLLLEKASIYLRGRYVDVRGFARNKAGAGVPLCKLHGSIDTDDLVPPTWNKTLAKPAVREAWQWAHDLLSTANEIRIIGYSLPEADSYVRYLLRSAAIDTPNLKHIDVLCWDPTGHVKARYDSFVSFRGYRFHSVMTESYFGAHAGRFSQWPDVIEPKDLEVAHRYTPHVPR